MDAALIDLGKRAVACEGWRWMPGMVMPNGWRVVARSGDEVAVFNGQDTRWSSVTDMVSARPDLSDPATLGCLLALVREAHGNPLIYCAPQEETGLGSWWCVCIEDDSVIAGGVSELFALICALECAR